MISQSAINALVPAGHTSQARSCLDLLERGIAKMERLEQARAKARAEMRGAIRKSRPAVVVQGVNAKLKNTGACPPRNKGCGYGRALSAAELDHAERLLGEGYALSKAAYMLDATQSSIERGLRARKGAA